ncbi:MAG: flagellar basal body L-ring protein FlgH [Acidobacteriia bacterium]|nr:flagellar basal body L-ring protein FlgH [Terriglobia bacterium]
MKYFLLIPMLLSAQSPGSLYSAAGQLADAARDVRASQVGDVVTILVSESLTAVASGATNTSRKSTAQANIKSLLGPTNPRLANLLDTASAQALQGQGQTSRNMTLNTTISARVTEVRPNGDLVIEATRDIAVNSEKQSIVVHGLVRAADLNPFNVVPSNRVADLQVKVNGKGVVGDAVKRPFILYRILLGLLPF